MIAYRVSYTSERYEPGDPGHEVVQVEETYEASSPDAAARKFIREHGGAGLRLRVTPVSASTEFGPYEAKDGRTIAGAGGQGDQVRVEDVAPLGTVSRETVDE